MSFHTENLRKIGNRKVEDLRKFTQNKKVIFKLQLTYLHVLKDQTVQTEEERIRLLIKNSPIPSIFLPSKPDNPVILERLGTTEKFSEKAIWPSVFFREKNQWDGIKFSLGEDFKTRFLNSKGKFPQHVPTTPLNVYQLSQASDDGPILAALGGWEMTKTRLAYVAHLIKLQPRGQEGPLITNRIPNSFYIEDNFGECRVVRCSWDPFFKQWRIESDPLMYPSVWGMGTRIFTPATFAS